MVVNSGISSASIPGHASICSTCQSFKDWYAEGEELASRQQFQKALRCFEEASILEPDSSSAVLYRGVCLIHLNQPQKALNILKALLEQEPDHSQGWLFPLKDSLWIVKVLVCCFNKPSALGSRGFHW
jgi:tetratricopeptide (TPR) repeat protein